MQTPREGTLISRRPWGRFQQFTLNSVSTVKIITVDPGHRLSLQTHEFRDEFWQVLDGPIDVTVDHSTWIAQTDDQIWIPRRSQHRMGNSGTQPSRVLEVAFGQFDEGDIFRLEDDYLR